MKHLIIIGARGFGREAYNAFFFSYAHANGEAHVKGFLDDKKDALDAFPGDWPPILGNAEDYIPQPDDVFFCAMGDALWRRHYAEIIENKGGIFIPIIAKEALLSPTTVIGPGCYIGPLTTISSNVRIGKHVMIQAYTNIGHDAIIGDYSSLESYVFLGGGASVGNQATLHTKSSILPHKSIGDEAVVGFGSVVMRNVPDGTHVFGNPAKKIIL